MKRYFGAWEAIQKKPIHLVDAMGYCRIQRNPIGARSLEALGALGRLGLEDLLLFMYPNFIL